MRILITGGAGFVGSALATAFRQDTSSDEIVVFDNLKRRGSELNLLAFKRLGIQFVHGDIRNKSDLDSLSGNFDLLIEASAEPSVLAGLSGSPDYLLQTNLVGTINCLEFARRQVKKTIFLSTSRVYSIAPLKNIRLEENDVRLVASEKQTLPGVSARGIAENFPTDTFRSLYGASKLASEQLIQEYAHSYGLEATINRCGVLAGPGQFGKVDQGVFSLWVIHHYFGKPLKYMGFSGTGKQVRDLMHPLDLYDLIRSQISKPGKMSAEIFNVGGGDERSVSLKQYTAICQKVLGKETTISSEPKTTEVDIPYYVSDFEKARAAFGWKPKRSVDRIVAEIQEWIRENEATVKALFINA